MPLALTSRSLEAETEPTGDILLNSAGAVLTLSPDDFRVCGTGIFILVICSDCFTANSAEILGVFIFLFLFDMVIGVSKES